MTVATSKIVTSRTVHYEYPMGPEASLQKKTNFLKSACDERELDVGQQPTERVPKNSA